MARLDSNESVLPSDWFVLVPALVRFMAGCPGGAPTGKLTYPFLASLAIFWGFDIEYADEFLPGSCARDGWFPGSNPEATPIGWANLGANDDRSHHFPVGEHMGYPLEQYSCHDEATLGERVR